MESTENPPPGYTLQRVLGKGKLGEVRECTSTEGLHAGHVFAVKFFTGSSSRATADECEILRHLRPHPNEFPSNHIIYSFLDYTETPDWKKLVKERFAVFELAQHTVEDILEAADSKLDPSLVHGLSYQIFLGLDFLHKSGVVHCDLKPANLLIVGSVASTYRLVIGDYGLSYLKGVGMDYKVTTEAGFIGYTPPELFQWIIAGYRWQQDQPFRDEFPLAAHPSRDTWAAGVIIRQHVVFSMPKQNKILTTDEDEWDHLPGSLRRELPWKLREKYGEQVQLN
ncbi:hypothetical protein MNV49_006297 [Pseudohyphozyma bogoriensis]|nr:hypothetical protein MNV49_006297 [Pseudohyphozyma bogoriensis]